MRQHRLRKWLRQVWRKVLPFLMAQLPRTSEEAAIVFTFALLLYLYLTTPPEEHQPLSQTAVPASEQHLSSVPSPLLVLTETPEHIEPDGEETPRDEQELPSSELGIPSVSPTDLLEDEEEPSQLEGMEVDLDGYSLAGDAEEGEEDDDR